MLLECAANHAVYAVGSNQQIAIHERRNFRDARAEAQIDASGGAMPLQNLKHGKAPHAGESAAVDRDSLSAENEDLIVPDFKSSREIRIQIGIGGLEKRERPIRQDDPPAVGCIRGILFVNNDLMRWVLLLHQQRKIKAARSATDDINIHGSAFATQPCTRSAGGSSDESAAQTSLSRISARGRRLCWLVSTARDGWETLLMLLCLPIILVLKRQASHLIRNMLAGQEWRRRS